MDTNPIPRPPNVQADAFVPDEDENPFDDPAPLPALGRTENLRDAETQNTEPVETETTGNAEPRTENGETENREPRTQNVERRTAGTESLRTENWEQRTRTGTGTGTGTDNFPPVSTDPGCTGAYPDAVIQAVLATVPKGPGFLDKQIFPLARAIKGFPDLAVQPPLSHELLAMMWRDASPPHIRNTEEELIMGAFCYAWPRVKFPKGPDPLALAKQRARSKPLPATAERFKSAEYKSLVCLCREMQADAGDKPFGLSYQQIADALGLPNKGMAGTYLALLEAKGVLEMVQKETPFRSRQYRYHGD